MVQQCVLLPTMPAPVPAHAFEVNAAPVLGTRLTAHYFWSLELVLVPVLLIAPRYL
jgi:hypothetical protein